MLRDVCGQTSVPAVLRPALRCVWPNWRH